MKRDCLQVRCGGESIYIPLKVRDVRVLDNHWHMPLGGVYRQMLGMDFFADMEAPPEEVVLVTHKTTSFQGLVTCLKNDLDQQDDLLLWNYSYAFSAIPGQRNGGSQSGFRVRGLVASISTRPSGYCDLELSAVRKGRYVFAELIDMRVVGSIETDDLGRLKIHRRRAPLLWHQELPRLLAFLQNASGEQVEILHSHMPGGEEEV